MPAAKKKRKLPPGHIPKIMPTSMAAEYLGCSGAHLNNLRNKGHVEQRSPGFYSKDELDRYAREGPPKPPADADPQNE